MKDKRFTPLMWCHLILMAALLLNCCVGTGLVLYASTLTDQVRTTPIVCMNTVNILALGCGIVYLCKRYGKDAAIFYKAFILLTAVRQGLGIVFSANPSGSVGFIVLTVFIVLLLLALAFWKDLGKRNTWILFSVLLACELVVGFFLDRIQKETIFQLVLSLSSLVSVGTIGLAIRGKYADKEARGTK